MKSMIRNVNDKEVGRYSALAFCCPGCAELEGGDGLHLLPVNAINKTPSWVWDGETETPTLSPSILTRHGDGRICHSYLRDGIFEFLGDCTHSLAGQKVPIADLPPWIEDM